VKRIGKYNMLLDIASSLGSSCSSFHSQLNALLIIPLTEVQPMHHLSSECSHSQSVGDFTLQKRGLSFQGRSGPS
jgi:hypothetical protein